MNKPATPAFRKAMAAARSIGAARTDKDKKKRIAAWAVFVKAAMNEEKKP
jgi:hypothetical protein